MIRDARTKRKEQNEMRGIISNCRDEIFDENLYLLTNCDVLIKYILVNMKFKEYASLFLSSLFDEMMIRVDLDSDRSFVDVKMESNRRIKFIDFVENTDNSINNLKKTIDTEGYVIVDTIVPLLRFMSFYNPDYDYTEYQKEHLLLILGYDEHNYYYVEHPALLNENYVHYPANNDIGCIEKAYFEDILTKRLHLFSIRFNGSYTLERANNAIVEMLQEYPKEYNKDCSDRVYWGHNAMSELINCFGRSVSMDMPSRAFPQRTLANVLPWRFSTIRNSRQLAKTWLEKHLYSYTKKDPIALSECMNRSYELWDQMTNSIFKCTFRNEPVNIKEDLIRVKEFEDENVRLIEELFILKMDGSPTVRQK